MGLPVAPSFQTAIRFSLIKKMTAISKNDMKTQVGEPLIFHILSDTLIICKEATSKRNVELVYTPIPVIQITIMKIHGLLFDMKIGSSKIMSLCSDNAESIQSFIDTIEMMKLDMMAVFEVNSKSALNTNHSTARPSPQKTHGFIDKSTFKPIKLNLVDTVPKKSMHCPTTEVHANETISKVDIKKSSVQIGAHQVKLRSVISFHLSNLISSLLEMKFVMDMMRKKTGI